MGEIKDQFANVYRDFVTDGLPSSGANDPAKTDIRLLGYVIEAVLGSVGSGLLRYATVANMNAAPLTNTSADIGKLAYVYLNNGSTSDAANGVYQWSGTGWVLAPWYLNAVSDAVTAKVNQHFLDVEASIARNRALISLTPIAPWTPAQATLFAWWDPADRSSLVFATSVAGDGNVVDQLIDKSGNGLTLTGISAAKRPGYDAGDAAPHLVFNGTGLAAKTANVSLSQPVTFFAAINDANGSGTQQSVVDVGNRLVMRSRQGSSQLLFAGTGLTPGNILPTGHFHGLSGSMSGGTGRLSVDGKTALTGAVGTNSATNVPIYVGDSLGADAPLFAGLGDVIIAPYETTPADDLHKRITGYLAWKWAFHESLEATHPYRYAPPVTGRVPVPAQIINRQAAMIPHGPTGSWYETNIFDPRVIVDPLDATKLMMFTSGQAAPVGTGTASIGLWRTTIAAMQAYVAGTGGTPWTFDRIVLQSGAAGQWDAQTGATNGVRLGSVVVRPDKSIDLYYSSQPVGSVGLATSTDGGATFSRYANNPILMPTGQGRNDGYDVSDPYVVYEDGRAVMFYTYRTGTFASPQEVLPGYRYATSTDGRAWTKGGDGDVLTRPHRGLQMEAMQVLRRNGRWYMVFEMGGNPTEATPYRSYLAVADRVTGPYTITKVLVTETGAASATTDRYHVATPSLFTLNEQDILFWSGAGDKAQPYGENHWDLFASIIVNGLA